MCHVTQFSLPVVPVLPQEPPGVAVAGVGVVPHGADDLAVGAAAEGVGALLVADGADGALGGIQFTLFLVQFNHTLSSVGSQRVRGSTKPLWP